SALRVVPLAFKFRLEYLFRNRSTRRSRPHIQDDPRGLLVAQLDARTIVRPGFRQSACQVAQTQERGGNLVPRDMDLPVVSSPLQYPNRLATFLDRLLVFASGIEHDSVIVDRLRLPRQVVKLLANGKRLLGVPSRPAMHSNQRDHWRVLGVGQAQFW